MSQSTCSQCGGPLPIGAVHCPHCGNAAIAAAPPAGADRVWTVNDGGKQSGPYTLGDLAGFVAGGRLSLDALAWNPSLTQWVLVTSLLPGARGRPRVPQYGYANSPYANAAPAPGVAIPILIAGIFHLPLAVPLCFSCFFILAIPQVVLAIFEIRFFVTAPTRPRPDLIRGARTLGILAIISIITFNIPALICGIITLALLPPAPQRAFGNL